MAVVQQPGQGEEWKARLHCPPRDTRIRTEVGFHFKRLHVGVVVMILMPVGVCALRMSRPPRVTNLRTTSSSASCSWASSRRALKSRRRSRKVGLLPAKLGRANLAEISALLSCCASQSPSPLRWRVVISWHVPRTALARPRVRFHGPGLCPCYMSRTNGRSNQPPNVVYAHSVLHPCAGKGGPVAACYPRWVTAAESAFILSRMSASNKSNAYFVLLLAALLLVPTRELALQTAQVCKEVRTRSSGAREPLAPRQRSGHWCRKKQTDVEFSRLRMHSHLGARVS